MKVTSTFTPPFLRFQCHVIQSLDMTFIPMGNCIFPVPCQLLHPITAVFPPAMCNCNTRGSRVIFPNGAIDPWHALGVLESPMRDLPVMYVKGERENTSRRFI